jgi:hypothetical protein
MVVKGLTLSEPYVHEACKQYDVTAYHFFWSFPFMAITGSNRNRGSYCIENVNQLDRSTRPIILCVRTNVDRLILPFLNAM